MDYIYYETIGDKENSYFDLKIYYDIKNYIINLICNDNKLALIELLPILKNEDYWYDCAYKIFKYIFLDSKLNEYTFYLLHKEYVKPEEIEKHILKLMLKNTSWGMDYIFNNLERILNKSDEFECEEIIEIIFNSIKYDKLVYSAFYQKILSINNSTIREKFISELLYNDIKLNDDEILRVFYKNTDDYDYKQEYLDFIEEEPELMLSKLPYLLMYYAKREEKTKSTLLKSSFLFSGKKKNNYFKDFIYNNFEILFKVEKQKKMDLLDYVMNDLSKETLNNYKELFRIYRSFKVSVMDQVLSIIVNYQKDDLLLELIKDKEISYLLSGSTTSAFRVGDKVIKFTQKKHFIDTEKDLFLLAPTETEVIYDEKNNPILIIEIQDYLEKNYNDKPMETRDIINFLDELENQGYVTTDPNCLEYLYDNFGFLKSYKDANCMDPEKLPEWFKERPIVMYDIDLVYKKDYPDKKTFKGYF